MTQPELRSDPGYGAPTTIQIDGDDLNDKLLPQDMFDKSRIGQLESFSEFQSALRLQALDENEFSTILTNFIDGWPNEQINEDRPPAQSV